jgi:hypothetical protein
MKSATYTVLFISSLLSPGEAGLASVRPAFLFLVQVNFPIKLRKCRGAMITEIDFPCLQSFDFCRSGFMTTELLSPVLFNQF